MWSATLANFSPISAGSLENIPVLWNTRLAGNSVDPTTSVVQFAFPVSSGDPLHPAQPVTWYAGSWMTGTTIEGYVALCLVGPGAGGVVVLTAGVTYDVWSRVTGNPEIPQKFCGQQRVY